MWQHEYGPKNETLQILKACKKGSQMNCWETMYIQHLHQRDLLITEQQVCEPNPLFSYIEDKEPRQYNSSTVSNATVRNTQPQTASGVTLIKPNIYDERQQRILWIYSGLKLCFCNFHRYAATPPK